jgi:hypothetical protein
MCCSLSFGKTHRKRNGETTAQFDERASDKVYRRDDRGVIGVESLSPPGMAFFVIHTALDARSGVLGSTLAAFSRLTA